jgi:diguanylate cyclase (GGDEF)-like protein
VTDHEPSNGAARSLPGGEDAPRATRRGRTVLLVEDDAVVGLDLKEALARLGFDVVGWVNSGEEAVRMAAERTPELVLMDVGLPGDMDGIEAARLIREQHDVPVIFLSGLADSSTVERAVAADPFGYLVKPFKEIELRCAIEVAVHKHLAEVAARERETALRESRELLRQQSLVDELTGLSNRRGFFSLGEQALKAARREQRALALLFADLDGLKRINDERGHALGDQALRDAALVLSRTFRDSDIVARIGGDEFAIIAELEDCDGADVLITRLEHDIAIFRATADRPYELSMSLGQVCIENGATECIGDLLADADAAMYVHKRRREAPATRTGRPDHGRGGR